MRRKRDSEVVKDGERIRVGMMFRDEDGLPGRVFRDDDGSKTEAADWQIDYVRDCKIAHGMGLEDGEALHRPGSRHCTDAAANDARAKAYFDAVAELQSAWRAPPARPIAERTPGLPRHESNVGGFSNLSEFHGSREGDLCTCRGPEYPLDFGSPGHLEERDGRLVCVPDNPREDSQSKMDAKDRAWLAMKDELVSAWRGKK